MSATAQPLLEVRGARKTYGAVRALEGVDLHIAEREIVAVVGDNGAGKSTLIKGISGVHEFDGGQILINGEEINLRSPADARELGIETVYQDLALFDNLGVASNFYAGREIARPAFLGPLAFVRRRDMARDARRVLDELRVNLPPESTPLGLMSGGQRQAVAVARAVGFATRVVILDEPTAALGVRESREVIDLVRHLPERGVSVILISHNLTEVTEIADRAVVLRRGRVAGELAPTAENHEELVSLIVGGAAPRVEAAEGIG